MMDYVRVRRISVAAIGLLWLGACTEMPTIRSFHPSNQAKVSSARHWTYIARDVAVSIHLTEDTTCVVIRSTDAATPTQFQKFLTRAVAAELLGKKYQANHPSGSARDREKNDPSSAAFKKLVIYDTAPASATCDSVNIEATVVPHSGPAAYPYPGQFTLLATGVIVIRNVVRAFSEASAVGAVAFAEGAWWATSGFRTGNDVTEITVTISRVRASEYLDQYVNVYYVASGDAGLYEATPPSQSFEVSPDSISACVSPPKPLVVSGDHLASQKEGYYLGSIQASQVRQAGTSPDGPLVVTFPEIPKAIFERDQLALTMIGSDNAVRKAYISTDPGGAHCANQGAAERPTPQFSVSPNKISACDEHAQFRVTGISLSSSKEAYSFGVIPAASVGTIISGESSESIAVNFTGLKSANSGRDRVELTMAAPDGSTRIAYIGVEGSAPASCATSKASPKAAGAKTTKPVAITLAPLAGQPVDASDLCAPPPLQMVVTGDGATSVNAANILGGDYPGIVDIRSDGKSTSVTLIFEKAPDFKTGIPADHILHVNLSLSGTKPGGTNTVTKVTIERPVRCGSAS